MKRLINISFFIAIALAFTSCEKVIEVKLNDASKKYVIEGIINNEPGNCTVSITQTKSFSENNNFPGVSGAVVTITDNGGAAIPLAETSAGKYSTNLLNGIPGHVYALKVVVGGQSFTASSTMPAAVKLDSIFLEKMVIFGDSVQTVRARFSDPPTKGNAYHFILYKNNIREKTVFATNDDYTNGNIVNARLMSYSTDSDDDKLLAGDSLKVIMECVDIPVYKYWFSLDGATGESNSATPTNPVSNITGGALGYFSAHTTQSKTMVVK